MNLLFHSVIVIQLGSDSYRDIFLQRKGIHEQHNYGIKPENPEIGKLEGHGCLEPSFGSVSATVMWIILPFFNTVQISFIFGEHPNLNTHLSECLSSFFFPRHGDV